MKFNTIPRALYAAALLGFALPAHADLTQWAAAANADASLSFLQTNVSPLPSNINIGSLPGDITYEFIVNGSPGDTESLLGSFTGGQSQSIKFDQFNGSSGTGTYGITHYGFADYDFGVPTTFGANTFLDFVSNSGTGTTELFVNGVDTGASIPIAVTLQGSVGIGATDFGAGYFDNYTGSIPGIAVFGTALSASEIQAHSTAFSAPAAVPEPGSMALLVGMATVGVGVLRKRRK